MKFKSAAIFALFIGLLLSAPSQAQEYQYAWDAVFDNAHGQTGTWTPFAFSGMPDSTTGTMAQSFETSYPIIGVRIHSPAWEGTLAGFRMRLFAWNTDYATTINGAVLGEVVIDNYADNSWPELRLAAEIPAGRYLLLTDQPYPSTKGNVGHWGWSNSNLAVDPLPAAYADGAIIGSSSSTHAVYDIAIGSQHLRPYTSVEYFYTEAGSVSAISLVNVPKIGQRFTATVPFDGIEVNGPTWNTNFMKGMTIRLYPWAGTYAATVAQATPLVTSVLTGLNDNFWFPCVGTTTLPPGAYFWEASQPTNSVNPADLNIGAYMPTESTYTDGEAFLNGVPQTSALSWVNLYRDPPGEQIAVQFTGWKLRRSLAQTFEVTEPFRGVAFTSATWGGTGAAYRMYLYAWNTDLTTTLLGPILKSQTFANYSDNSDVRMILDAEMPAGQYLLYSDEPVQGTGAAGHWAFKNSPYVQGTAIPSAYIDKKDPATIGYPGLVFWISYGIKTDAVVAPDFRSRAVVNIANVKDWSLY